jgi:hypothetical protein
MVSTIVQTLRALVLQEVLEGEDVVVDTTRT